MATASSTGGAVATGGVVKAVDLLPSTFGAAGRTDSSGKADDLQYDLGSLTAVDTHQVDLERLRKNKEGYLHKLAKSNAQLLMKHLFALPVERTEQGPVVSACRLLRAWNCAFFTGSIFRPPAGQAAPAVIGPAP